MVGLLDWERVMDGWCEGAGERVDVGLGFFWTGTAVCVVWEGREGGEMGRRQGGKASSSIGQLDPYHTPLPSAPSCVTN
jgi:hypothetical protein